MYLKLYVCNNLHHGFTLFFAPQPVTGQTSMMLLFLIEWRVGLEFIMSIVSG